MCPNDRSGYKRLGSASKRAEPTLADNTLTGARQQIITLAAEHHLPAMYFEREYVQNGGLISYGPNAVEVIRRSTALIDKVLKGAKPADLPIEQPTKFELVINLKTAKSLGLHYLALAAHPSWRGDRIMFPR